MLMRVYFLDSKMKGSVRKSYRASYRVFVSFHVLRHATEWWSEVTVGEYASRFGLVRCYTVYSDVCVLLLCFFPLHQTWIANSCSC